MDRQDRGTVYLSVVVLTVFVLMTMIRNETWRSEMTLWRDVMEKSPTNPVGPFEVGRQYHKSGNGQAAFTHYQLAMRLANARTDFRSRDILALAQANMGGLLIATGKADDRKVGILALQASMSLMPHHGPSVLWLSQALNEDRRFSETITLIDEAVQHGFGPGFSPLSGPLYMNKGVALCALGFADQANLNFQYAAAHYADIPSVQCSQEEGF